MRVRKFDAHIHCTASNLNILKNALDYAEFDGALVLPFVGQSLDIYEESLKLGYNNLTFAYSINNQYQSIQDFERELSNLEEIIKYYCAIKFYKDAFFEGIRIGENRVYLWDELAAPIFKIAKDAQKTIIIHCADPVDFWLTKPVIRQKQLERNPLFYHLNTDTIPRAEQLAYRDILEIKYPFNKFYFAHLGGFPQTATELLDILSHNFVVDTSAAIEECLLLNEVLDIADVIEKNKSKILFGSDLFVISTTNGYDKLTTLNAISFLKQTSALFFGPGVTLAPNYFELGWKVNQLCLNCNTIKAVFSDNFERLFLHYGNSSNTEIL